MIDNDDLESYVHDSKYLVETLTKKNLELHKQFDLIQEEKINLAESLTGQLELANQELTRLTQLLVRQYEAVEGYRRKHSHLYQPRPLFSMMALLTNLECVHQDILKSVRWRMGNVMVRPVELLLFRWRKKLVTRHMDLLFGQVRELSQSDKDPQVVYVRYAAIADKLRDDFVYLFESKRWQLGTRAIGLTDKLLLRKNTSNTDVYVCRIFERIDSLLAPKGDSELKQLIRTVRAESFHLEDSGQVAKQEAEFPSATPPRNRCSAPTTSSDVNPAYKSASSSPAETETSATDSKELPLRQDSDQGATYFLNCISIVMPMFNCEKYVEQAINSVIAQAWESWELICIDDCSNDSTYSIVSQFARLDGRIKVFRHYENRGKGCARNTGLRRSQGDLIFFLDADDWLAPSALDSLFEVLNTDNVDIALGQIRLVREGTGELSEGVHATYQNLNIRGTTPAEQPLLLENGIVCNKLIRRSFMDKYSCSSFNEGLERFEDSELAMRWWLHAPRVSLVSRPTYFYRQQADDLPDRSNRKVGGLERASYYRVAMALELLRYQSSKQLFEDRLLLPRLLVMIVRVLRRSKGSVREDIFKLAQQCAMVLPSFVIVRICDEYRNIVLALRDRSQMETLEVLNGTWDRIQNISIEEIVV